MSVAHRYSLGRLGRLGRLGTPEEAAHAIAFLAPPLASYTTGSFIDDSGRHSRHV